MRSPFYAPAELLSVIECQAFGLFGEIFGDGGALRYHDGVRVNRTGCLAKHPHDDHATVGAFRHIETMELREEDVDDLFFSEEESDEVVEARFVNDGEDSVDIYWRVLKLETLEAGKETAFETTAGSRWSFRRGDDVLKSVRVGRATCSTSASAWRSSLTTTAARTTFVSTDNESLACFDAGERGSSTPAPPGGRAVETYRGPCPRPTPGTSSRGRSARCGRPVGAPRPVASAAARVAGDGVGWGRPWRAVHARKGSGRPAPAVAAAGRKNGRAADWAAAARRSAAATSSLQTSCIG